MRSVLAVLALLPSLASAQSTTGATVDGFVFDSINGVPLAGASIRLADTMISSDLAGRFRATGLPAGTHKVTFRHAILDSLGVPAAFKSVTLTDQKTTYVDLGIPSARTLLSALCPRALSEMNGVLGVVRDADTDAPIPRATVRLSWSVILLDRRAGVRSQPEFRGVSSDASGLYAICDAPADLDQGTLIAFAKDFDVARVETTLATGGVAVQHLYLGRTNSDPATLVGTVLNDQSAPIEGAEVLPVNRFGTADTAGAGVSARTNPQGIFALSGLRPGTQMIEVRRLGHQRIRRSVTLASGRATTLDPVTLLAIVTRLPDVIVREKSTAERLGFTDRLKQGRGRFYTREDIAKQKQILRSADLVREHPGLRLEQRSGQMVITNESLRQNIKGQTCALSTFVDGVPAPTDHALDIAPRDIDGVEIYNVPEMVPSEFAGPNQTCGAILIWTTWRNRKNR